MKIGIDIGGSHISIGLVKDQGKIIYKEEKEISTQFKVYCLWFWHF